MRVIIIEDEVPAAKRLAKLLQSYSDEIEVVHTADSVESSVRYLTTAQNIDFLKPMKI